VNGLGIGSEDYYDRVRHSVFNACGFLGLVWWFRGICAIGCCNDISPFSSIWTRLNAQDRRDGIEHSPPKEGRKEGKKKGTGEEIRPNRMLGEPSFRLDLPLLVLRSWRGDLFRGAIFFSLPLGRDWKP